MSDVAHILGLEKDSNNRTQSSTTELPTTVPTFLRTGKKQLKQQKNDQKNNKQQQQQQPRKKWTWAPFTSSSRPDGLALHHWVRAGVEYPDYPYARFDIHMDPVHYTTEEYHTYFVQAEWSQSETDALMECVRTFELRWPVIHDRWCAIHTPRPVEELQHRYYSIAAKLLQRRISHEAAVETKELEAAAAAAANATTDDSLILETAAARTLASSDPHHQPLIQQAGTGTSNKVFDLAYEKERRAQWEAMWRRTKADEAEEYALRNELKQVEAQLRKLKKRGAHVAGATTVSSLSAAARATPEVAVQQVHHAMATTTPIPVPGVPYLQSARLLSPATGGDMGISKALLTRMESLLAEMNVSASTVIPTKRACDLMDTVRRDALTWLLLEKQVIQREGILRARRLKLAKMGGNIRVVDEETLMGIAPPPVRAAKPVVKPVVTKPVPVAAPAAAVTGKAKAPSTVKTATGLKPVTLKKTISSSATATTTSTATTADAKPRKPSVKRKRKSEGAAVPLATTVSSSDAPVVSNSNNKPTKKPKTDNPSSIKAAPVPAATIPDKGTSS